MEFDGALNSELYEKEGAMTTVGLTTEEQTSHPGEERIEGEERTRRKNEMDRHHEEEEEEGTSRKQAGQASSEGAMTSQQEVSKSQPPLLRLVLLGQSGSGKTTAARCILGNPSPESSTFEGNTKTHSCRSSTATVAGRQVTVVDTPDWFSSDLSPEAMQAQIGSCMSLLSPGPHAFLLCVPVDQRASVELAGLGALEQVFGSGATSRHTLVLFTHMDQLPSGVPLEEFVTTRGRQDLLALVERCGDHYHGLETTGRSDSGGRGEEERERRSVEEERERRSVEELLEKVEQVIRESGVDFHAWPAPQEPKRSTGLRRDREGWRQIEEKPVPLSTSSPPTTPLSSPKQDAVAPEPPAAPTSPQTCDDNLKNSGGDGDDDPCLLTDDSSAVAPPSFFRGLWDTMTGWLRRVPGLVRGSALLGALVGFFVGGPIGKMLGMAVGSVATEVGRRRKVKKNQ